MVEVELIDKAQSSLKNEAFVKSEPIKDDDDGDKLDNLWGSTCFMVNSIDFLTLKSRASSNGNAAFSSVDSVDFFNSCEAQVDWALFGIDGSVVKDRIIDAKKIFKYLKKKFFVIFFCGNW